MICFQYLRIICYFKENDWIIYFVYHRIAYYILRYYLFGCKPSCIAHSNTHGAEWARIKDDDNSLTSSFSFAMLSHISHTRAHTHICEHSYRHEPVIQHHRHHLNITFECMLLRARSFTEAQRMSYRGGVTPPGCRHTQTTHTQIAIL